MIHAVGVGARLLVTKLKKSISFETTFGTYDLSDLRFLDKPGTVTGVRAKVKPSKIAAALYNLLSCRSRVQHETEA
jgi:hypothetical protein